MGTRPISKSPISMHTLLLLYIFAMTLCGCKSRTQSVSSTIPIAKENSGWISAPGRVEPISEEIEVGAQLEGILKQVPVDEGDHVNKGQILAVIDNDDYLAQVSLARARVMGANADLQKVLNGARIQERQEELARLTEAKTIMDNAELIMKRRKMLFSEGFIPEEQRDQAISDYNAAKARYELAHQGYSLIQARSREEDITRAQADVAAARNQLRQAIALYEKTFVRAPISGTVLRKKLKAGETFSFSRDTYIVTLGDLSILRVRAEVDESDVSKLRIGEKAYVTSPAYGREKFWGKVVRVGKLFGRKNVRTDQPAEHVDTKILETLIRLDDGHSLPIGSRVDAYIQTDH